MFNFATICESVRRHWVVIAIVGVLSLTAGVASSFVKDDAQPAAVSYTAEASLYLTGYGYGEKDAGEYNYSYNESLAISDARRLVVSSEVAGKVREQYGSDVQVTAPVWMNESKNTEISTRFIYIDVTAADPETAKAACQTAADLAQAAIEDTLPVEDVSLAEPVALTGSGSSKAADWGRDAFVTEDVSSVEAVASGISMKKVVIFVFSGLALSILAFAAYDILSRRVRSSRDVERLLDLPVLASVSQDGDLDRLVQGVRVLMDRSELGSVAVAGASATDGAQRISKALADAGDVVVSGCIDLSGEADAAVRLLGSDTVLLVISEAASKGSELECALKQLRIAGVPVLGVVFVPKKPKRARR